MDVSARELRNHTARVIAAGEPVVLTVHGRPTELLLKDLEEISELARRLGVVSDPDDFDTGLTTDDMM